MSIVVRDETANAVVITIDNNGNMAFGNGTPINMLTLDGFGLIDVNGHILNGVSGATFNPVTGSISLGPQGNNTGGLPTTANVSTTPGVIPIVQIDTTYPAHSYTFSTGEISVTQPVIRLGIVQAGGFGAANNNSETVTAGHNGFPTNLGATFTYRWL